MSQVPSTSGKSSDVIPEPWNIIIINQVPEELDDDEKLISLFSQYGKIVNTYWNEKISYKRYDRTATITFSNEEDASKVFEASKDKLIKYKDKVLMITLASNNYSPIQNLPDICLRQIFEHLYSIEDKFRVEMVCKRWKDIGRCSWSNITEIGNYRYEINTWRVIIPRIASSLLGVEICAGSTELEYFLSIAKHCTNLKRLECMVAEADYAFVALQILTILQKNLNLRKLKFNANDNENMTINFMEVLPVGLEDIKIWTDQFEIIPAGVALSKFQNLRHLSLRCLTISDHHSIDGMVNLEKLALLRCQIPDSILSQILENNKNLKYLHLARWGDSGMCLEGCLPQLSKLQVLVIDGYDSIDASCLGCLPSFKGLICFDCPSITDRGIRNFLDSASAIKEIQIFGCSSFTIESIVIARKWTERTGKFLKIWVDNELEEEYRNEYGLSNTEMFELEIGDVPDLETQDEIPVGSWLLE